LVVGIVHPGHFRVKGMASTMLSRRFVDGFIHFTDLLWNLIVASYKVESTLLVGRWECFIG